MLQQTQVSRVIDYFTRFIARFPDVRSLASAEEQEVLALWSGLGYYRRAKNLHAAARMIVSEFGGVFPQETDDLRRLPGVGPYTAGALASMAGGRRVPLVDGNVVRVLLRIEGREGTASDRATMQWTWQRAAELVKAAEDPGVLNEGIMELGAIICTPDLPACPECPVRRQCVAAKTGRQREIPSPKKAAPRRDLHCAAVLVRAADGRLLMERRDDTRMWAGMWQALTVERDDRSVSAAEIADALSDRLSRCSIASTRTRAKQRGGTVSELRQLGTFVHQTTHRHVLFEVWECEMRRAKRIHSDDIGWRTLDEALLLPLSNAQRRVLGYAHANP